MSYISDSEGNTLRIEEKGSKPLDVECENIDSFAENDEGTLTIIYSVPVKSFLGKMEMEQRIEKYDCAEGPLLIKTFNGIRQAIMKRDIESGKPKKAVQKPPTKMKGGPPVTFWKSRSLRGSASQTTNNKTSKVLITRANCYRN